MPDLWPSSQGTLVRNGRCKFKLFMDKIGLEPWFPTPWMGPPTLLSG